MIEKIRIETRDQVATIKWWLRQAWRDERLSWNLEDYTYSEGTSNTRTVPRITRPGGIEGGVWVRAMNLMSFHDGLVGPCNRFENRSQI